MRGVQYVTDEKGEKTAVLIDLKKNGELWEDFYDYMISRERENEPRETLESVRKRIKKNGKR
jgi:oligoribonuclease NrnB/cAMP/cGMP phosphodiesterase (DHH superfamily)